MPTPTTASSPVTTTNPLGPGSQPLLLRATQLDPSTGRSRIFDVERRCGSRLASRCASCSALYVGDAKAVIRSGLVREDGQVKQTTLVTLTAPGASTFGATHRSGRNKRGKRTGRCACGQWHNASDPLVSTPMDPGTYDYQGAAAFNAAAGRLATVTFQKLSRILGRPLQVMRVAEYQRRGLLHIHALVIGEVSSADLALAVGGGINPRTGRRIQATSHDGWTWGPRCDARALRLGDGKPTRPWLAQSATSRRSSATSPRPLARAREAVSSTQTGWLRPAKAPAAATIRALTASGAAGSPVTGSRSSHGRAAKQPGHADGTARLVAAGASANTCSQQKTAVFSTSWKGQLSPKLCECLFIDA